jgi:hypothetical protein
MVVSSKRRRLSSLVAVGVGAALVGLLAGCGGSSGSTATDAQAQEQAQGQAALCSSLASLRSATGTLVALDSHTASKSAYQSALAAVQTAWQQVAAEAKTVAKSSLSSLDDAWQSYDAAVKAVPAGDSVSASVKAISTQARALQTATQKTTGSLQC